MPDNSHAPTTEAPVNITLKWGIILGLLVVAWTFVIGFAGWHTDPVLQMLFWLVIPAEIAVLVLALGQTAAQGRGYGAQVGAGTLVALVAAVLIFAGSYIFTAVVFPNYFAEVRAAGQEMFRSQGKSELEIQTLMDAMAPMQTHFMNALLGALGTIGTGVLASLIIAIFVRKKA